MIKFSCFLKIKSTFQNLNVYNHSCFMISAYPDSQKQSISLLIGSGMGVWKGWAVEWGRGRGG